MSINREDAQDAQRLSTYLTSSFSEAISTEDCKSAKYLSGYLSRNVGTISISEDDVKNVEKLCNYINTVIRR